MAGATLVSCKLCPGYSILLQLWLLCVMANQYCNSVSCELHCSCMEIAQVAVEVMNYSYMDCEGGQ